MQLILALLLSLSTAFGPIAFAPSMEGISTQDDAITVFLVRHAEKCSAPASDPDLTPYGQQRTQDLVRVLSHVELDAVYSTPFARTLNTASPVAAAHDVNIIETPAERGFMEALAERIKNGEANNVLVSGHSNTTPRVVNLLAGTEFEDLDESVYDRLYIVTLHEDGTAGVQVLTYGAISGSEEDCG